MYIPNTYQDRLSHIAAELLPTSTELNEEISHCLAEQPLRTSSLDPKFKHLSGCQVTGELVMRQEVDILLTCLVFEEEVVSVGDESLDVGVVVERL